MQHVESILICDIPSSILSVPFWQADLHIHLYTLSAEGSAAETLEGASDVTAYHEWMLPCTEFHNLWEHLVFEEEIKADLLNYATAAFFFSKHNVNPTIISLNRVLLLHGPPGTGKTSLCKALAQKLSIRYYSQYHHIALIEINSHSLFSKWFSESGKLVMKLFDYIHDLLANADTLLFILIDEVESLSASRKASLSGSEPSDGMRVVNALLTQIDKLRNNADVMILTTSNLSGSIDDAFIDRADIKRFIGNPGMRARFLILRDCLEELMRTAIIQDSIPRFDYETVMASEGSDEVFSLFRECVYESDGLSGRCLRKLPFQAYAMWLCGSTVSLKEYLNALKRSVIV
ncbi:hypothetical protein JH06_4085 [Blastocystis sp. subtype 4]|uniref:hypothetical protein n=1 Tax=Blastocystis sp. subtype 4 TaxID=944170 RepID=UPI000711F31C|nr:hypothetical protein JH06_4085 [Blastocystis sp. subtype 4]KNB42280.1 hypothetical protein JH06_4085 [Blastocystis sp. subtype 4]|eukprot:XP_014525723.1 hypothetical protein JH06_4085 [Blastocystis sp. subtype 4]